MSSRPHFTHGEAHARTWRQGPIQKEWGPLPSLRPCSPVFWGPLPSELHFPSPTFCHTKLRIIVVFKSCWNLEQTRFFYIKYSDMIQITLESGFLHHEELAIARHRFFNPMWSKNVKLLGATVVGDTFMNLFYWYIFLRTQYRNNFGTIMKILFFS